MDADDFARNAMRAGSTPAMRELRVEVRVFERTKEAGAPGQPEPPWSTFRQRNLIVLNEAAIKWERVSGNNGEGISVHAGGTAEESLEEARPQGRVN